METKPNWEKLYFDLLEKVEKLEIENRELREKLNTNSKNSSKPPSQDPNKKPQRRPPSGRKPGGQPGHSGHNRQMASSNQLTKTVDLKPELCPHCNSNLFEDTLISVECRQTIELPVIQPEITQYNIYTCRCSCCRKCVRPNIPKEAEKGFGPRLMGFLTMLSGEAGVTKRKICSIAAHLGVKISLGALCNVHRLASDVLKEPFDLIRDSALAKNNLNADETSWWMKNQRHWIWIGATATVTFFKIDLSRSQEAFCRIFGEFKGTLSSDRYAAYNPHIGNRQSCLAHIDRDFTKMSEREGEAGALGRILSSELGVIFGLWKQFKKGEFDRANLQKNAAAHVENIRVALTVAACSKEVDSKSSNLCYNLIKRFSSLWTFLYEEGVEPTNNLAERGLRPAVIVRKISGGSQSEWGLRFTERLLTVACTLRQQAKNLFEFLTKSFESYFYGSPSPPIHA
jgi:transposase